MIVLTTKFKSLAQSGKKLVLIKLGRIGCMHDDYFDLD